MSTTQTPGSDPSAVGRGRSPGAVPAAVPRRTGRTRRPPVVPNQHGAWGFLALPLVLGGAASDWSWWVLLLTVAWVAAYPSSWAVTGLLTARRPARFRRAALIWIPLCLVAGVPLLLTHLWLSWVLLAYLLLFLVNLQQARARRERSVFNDLVLIGECVLLVPVVAGLAASSPAASSPAASSLVASSPADLPLDAMTTAPVITALIACALTLIGSTLHVKSLIRERNNPTFTRLSQAFAVACVPLMAVTTLVTDQPLLLTVPFVLIAVRAWLWHDPALRPSLIGMGELAGFLVVAGTSLVVI
ncbi:YwiC-like family protein [Kineosporia succinea]|uniref:YwiC-like protein n=1 Tax=Kineosporia succinea TaxID=84632 RepID=A0ABT9P7Y5_9ACTN|nr:YwiC-like family protein [Kineosporia succinea]MDP9828798.1 hypothetical protein [Kineosporia succinea]